MAKKQAAAVVEEVKVDEVKVEEVKVEEVKVEEVKVEEVKVKAVKVKAVKVDEVKVEEVKVDEVKVRVTVGATAIAIILAQPELTNQQVLEKVKETFPTAQTSMACIAWYKSKLRKEGKIGARMFANKTVAQPAAE